MLDFHCLAPEKMLESVQHATCRASVVHGTERAGDDDDKCAEQKSLLSQRKLSSAPF